MSEKKKKPEESWVEERQTRDRIKAMYIHLASDVERKKILDVQRKQH